MLPEQIQRSSVLDILFENRNKSYGAYELRRNYPLRLARALGGVVLVTALLALLLNRRPVQRQIGTVEIELDTTRLIAMPVEKKQPQAEQPAARQTARREIDYQRYVIVDSTETVDPIPTADELREAVVSNRTVEGAPVSPGELVAPAGQARAGQGTDPQPESPEPAVFEHVERMPEFPGGMEALKRFIHRHVAQPDDLEPGQKRMVVARFVVQPDGRIELASIVRSGREDLDREVLRLIGKMPAWKPGEQNGRRVAVYFQLPVTFAGEEN